MYVHRGLGPVVTTWPSQATHYGQGLKKKFSAHSFPNIDLNYIILTLFYAERPEYVPIGGWAGRTGDGGGTKMGTMCGLSIFLVQPISPFRAIPKGKVQSRRRHTDGTK